MPLKKIYSKSEKMRKKATKKRHPLREANNSTNSKRFLECERKIIGAGTIKMTNPVQPARSGKDQ